LSSWSLSKQQRALGAAWIDREFSAHGQSRLSDEGFGGEVRNAMQTRRAFLIEKGILEQSGAGIDGHVLHGLERIELAAAGKDLAEEFGKPFVAALKEGSIQGRYVRDVELASGRYALLERKRELTLVPWRRALERVSGRQLIGVARNGRVTWDWGKGRGR